MIGGFHRHLAPEMKHAPASVLNPVSYTHLDVYKRQQPYCFLHVLNTHSDCMQMRLPETFLQSIGLILPDNSPAALRPDEYPVLVISSKYIVGMVVLISIGKYLKGTLV